MERCQPGHMGGHEGIQLILGMDILSGQDAVQQLVPGDFFEKVHGIAHREVFVAQDQLALDATFERAGREGSQVEKVVKAGIGLGFQPEPGRLFRGIRGYPAA